MTLLEYDQLMKLYEILESVTLTINLLEHFL